MPTLPSGINFGNQLTPSNSAHDGIIHSMNIKGGFQEVISITERNLIPTLANDSNGVYNAFTLSGDGGYTSGRRKIGMLVYVLETNKFYNLLPIGYFGNEGALGQAEWLALPEWERALRIDPIGSYTSQTGNPGNGFTTIIKTASDIGITADANLCWVEANFSSGSGNINDTITENFFTAATDGATGIILGQSAIETDNTKVYVNGHLIRESSYSWKKDGNIVTADSLENGTELVWNAEDAGFALDSTDKIQIVYETRISGSNNSEISSTITGHLIPDADEAHDLGSPTNKFRDIYMSGNTLYMGGQPLSIVNGALTLNGSPVTGGLDVYKANQTSNSAIQSQFAFSIPGSTTGAILSPTQNRALVEDGTYIKVYRLQNGTWSQEGSNISTIGDNHLTTYGNGQRRWSKDGSSFIIWNWQERDTLKSYYWNGTNWQQRGLDISMISIRAVDINHDGTKITAIDRASVSGNSSDRLLRTFIWNGTSWQEATHVSVTSASGSTMSADGNKIALRHSTGGTNTLYVMEWSGTEWGPQTIITTDVWNNGEFSGDGNALFINKNAHDMRVYFWNGTVWQLTSFTADLSSTGNVSYNLSEDGTKLLLSSGFNDINKWSIWEYDGSTWSLSSINRESVLNTTSSNYDLSLVLSNSNLTDFYTYDVSSPINDNMHKYLNTRSVNEGDIIDVWFDATLGYTPLETCYIYTDELNWIGARVIQNTTGTNNLLKVEILEYLGLITSYEYSISNMPIRLSDYKKETISLQTSTFTEIDDVYFSWSFPLPSLKRGQHILQQHTDYQTNNQPHDQNKSFKSILNNVNHVTSMILDPTKKYKYRSGSLRGIIHNNSNFISSPMEDFYEQFYVVALRNDDLNWPDGLTDLPSTMINAHDQIGSLILLDAGSITPDNPLPASFPGNSIKLKSDYSNNPIEIELSNCYFIAIVRRDPDYNWADYFNLNYDLIHYTLPNTVGPTPTPLPTMFPTATPPTPTSTPAPTPTATPPTPTSTPAPTSTPIPDPATIVIDDISHQFTSIQQMNATISWTLSDDLYCTNIKIEQWNTYFQQWISLTQNGNEDNGYPCSRTFIAPGSPSWCGATVSFRAIQSNPEGYADVISEVYVKTFPACPPLPTATPIG